MVCCYVLLLLCFTVTVNSIETKDEDKKEKAEFLINQMTEALFVIRTEDREKFMRKCTEGIKVCTEKDVGDKAEMRWVIGISEEATANFWSSYKCFLDRKEVLCPINGGWTTWTHWGQCQVECGDLSEVKRTRSCMNPVPMNNGLQCFGVNSEKRLCKGRCTGLAKKKEGELESLTFIHKIQELYPSLNETCFHHHCTYESLKIIEKIDIKDKYWASLQCYKYQRACPVDGQWSSWSSWSKCSPDCGDGFHFRSRECDHPAPSDGGFKCLGKTYQEEPCVGLVCTEKSEVNPILSSWSNFHACTVPCGKYGTAKKERQCLNPHLCPNGLKTQKIIIEKPCYLGACPSEGVWSKWSTFTNSSAVCGKGRSMRFRVCNEDKPVDGAVCKGKTVERFPMNGNCTAASMQKFQSEEIEAKKKALRRVFQRDKPPDDEADVDPMNPFIEDYYTSWSTWTKCSKTCATGIRERFRGCKNITGLRCKGERWQVQPCNLVNCPVMGGWSEWETWTVCSVTCGFNGIRTRYRRCDKPYAMFGGSCVGISEETTQCQKTVKCDERISYSDWSTWSGCSKSCGNGEKLRTRKCIKPKKNRIVCSRSDTKVKSRCNVKPCPINGNWGNWNSWSSCSTKCGIGHHFRDRTCTYPAPKYNGTSCFGPGSDIMTCFKMPCTATIHKGVSLKNGYLLYKKRGYPAGYYSLFLLFKPTSNKKAHLLKHEYNGCKNEMTCKNSLELIIDENKVLVNMNSSGTIVKMKTEDESIQAKKWHNIYLHLSEDRVFLRLDEGKKYETKLEADKKIKINFDGFTRIGSFSGDVASLRMNLKEYALDKERSRSFTSPKKSKNNTNVIFKADSVNGIVGYSLFRGNSFVKIPVKANEALKVQLVFLAISTDGVLFFNKGKTAGSYVYIILIKGTMKMCVSIGQSKKCETILNINIYKWYSISLLVSGQKLELRVNEGSAFQVSFLEHEYHPATPVCIGGGEKEDLFMYLMVIGIKEGFQGVIHEITVNDKTFEMHAKPILNDMGIISSIGLTNPERVSVAYEHQESEVKFRCDYTDYKEESGNSMVEWFKEDFLVDLSNLVKINHKYQLERLQFNILFFSSQMPGEGYVSELTLLPSDNQTGLYSCAVRKDGVYTVLHSFILIRHDVKIEHFPQEVELLGLEIFLIFVPILLIGCIAAAVVDRLKSLKKEKMQIIQKTLKDEFQNSMSKLPLVEKPEQDGPGDDINVALDQADKDPNDLGLTDEMDTTRQHDDLETSGIYDEIDIDKTSKTNEFDTTGPIDDEDMDDGYETIIFTTKKTEPKIQKKSGPDREDFMSKFQGNEFQRKWDEKINEWKDKKDKLRAEGKPIFEKPAEPDREDFMSKFHGKEFQRKWDEKISEWQDKKDKLRAEGKPIFEKPAEAQSKESKGSVRWSTPDIHSAEAFPRSSQMIRKHHSAPNQPLTNEYHPETSSGPTRSKSMPYHSYRSKTYQSSEMVSGRPPYSIPSQEMLDSAAQLYRKQFKSSSSSQQSARNLYATVTRQSGERPKPPPAPPPPPPPTPPIPPKTWDMSALHPSSHQSVNNRNARLQIEAKHSSQQLGGDQHGRRISQISTRDPSDLMFPPGSRQSGSDQYDLNAWQSEGSLPPPPFPYTPPTPLPPGSRQSGNDQYDLTTWKSEGSLPPPPLFPPGSRQSGNDQYALTTWQSEGSLPPPPILPPGSQQSGNDQYALTTWQSEESLPPPPLPLTPPPPLSPGSRQSRNDQYDFNAWQSEGNLPPYPPPPPPPPPPRQHQRQDILPPHLRSQQSINNHKARMQMAAKLSSQQLGGDEQVRNKSQISDFIIYHRSRQSINDQNASNARLSAQRFPPPPTENQDMSAPHLSSQQSIEDHYARLQMAAKHSSQQLGGDMHARKISQISSKGLSDFTSSPRSQQSVNDQFAVNARQSAERRPSYQTESQDMLAPHLSSQQSIENRNSRLQMETKHSSRQFEGDQHSRKIPQISLKGQSNFTLPPGSRQSVNEQYVKDARQSVERLPPPQTESQDMLAPHLSRQQSIENRNSRLQIEGQHPSQHSGGDMHARKISHISSKGLSDFTSSPRSQQSVNDQFAVNARQSAESYPPYQTESQDMLAPHPSSQQSIENRNSRLQMETKHSSRQFEGDQHSRKIPKISLKGPSNFTLPPGSRQLVNEQYVKDARQSVERLPPPQTESQEMLAPHLSRQQSIENQYARLQMGARLSSQSVTHHKAGASRTLQMTESFKSHPSESEGLSTTRMGRRQISDVQYSSQTSNMLRQHPSYPNQGQDLLYPSEHPASKTSQMVKRRSSISSQGQVMSDTVQKVRSQKVQNIQNASMTTQMVDQYSTQDLISSVPLPPSYQSKTGSLVSKPKQMTSQRPSTSPQRQNMLDTAPYISSQQSRDGKHASNTMQMTGGHISYGTQTSFIHQGFKDNLHTRKSSQMAARRLSDPMQKAAVTNLQTSHEGEKTPDIQYNSRNSMDVAKGHLSDPTHRWTHLESQRRESAEDIQYISKHSYAVSRSPQKSLHMDKRSSYESFPPPPSTWTLVSKDSRNETSPLKKDFNSKPIPYEGPLSGQRTMLHRSPPRILPPQRRASLTSDTSPLPKVLRSPPRKLLSPTVEISSERSESLPDDVSVGSQSRMLSFSNQEMSSQDKLRSMQDDSESQQNAASAPHHLPSSHEKIRSTQDVYVSPQKAASAPRYIPSSQEKIRSVQDVHVSPQKAASSKRHVTSSHEKIRSTQDVNVSGQIAASAPHNVLSSPDNIRSIQDVYGSPQIAASAPLNVPSSLDNIRSLQNIYGSPQKAASAPHYNIIRSVQEVSGSLQKAASAPQHAPSSTETIRSIQDVYGSLQKASSYPSRVPSSQENIKSLQDILGSPQIESSAPRHAPSSTETIRSIQEVYGSPQKAASAPRQAPSSTETIRSIQDVYGSPKIAASYPSRVPSSVESNRSIQDIYGSPQKATSAPRQAPSSPDKIRSIQDVYGSQQEAESYQRHEPSSTEKIRSMQNVHGSPPKSSSAQGSVPSSMEKIRSMQNVYGSPPKSSSAQGSVPSSTDKIRSMQDVYGSPQKSSSAQGSVPSSMEKIRSMQNVYESPPKSSSAQGSVPSSTEKIRSMQNVYGSPPQFSSAQGSVPSSKEKIRSIQDVYGSPPKSSLAQGSVPSSMEKIRSMQNVYESPPKSSSAQGSVPSSTEKIRSMQDVYGSPPKSPLAQGSVPSSMEKIRSIQDFSGYPQKAASINDDIGMKSYTSDDNVSVHSLLSITHKSTTSKSDFSSLQSRGSFTAKSDESVQSYDDLIDRDFNYT